MTDEETERAMQLEVFMTMQHEAGSEHPDLKKLAACCKAMSAVGDQAMKEAFVVEMRERQKAVLRSRGMDVV